VLGAKISSLLSTGKLVPDDIVLSLLYNRIQKMDAKSAFILDGFPRKLNQVTELMHIFEEMDVTDYVVIYLAIDYEEAMHRTLGRMICENCKQSFNKYKEATKPKVDGICDFCGSELKLRDDDTESTFKVRYQDYMDATKPVIDYFRNHGKLVVVDANGNPQEMFKQIEKNLEV